MKKISLGLICFLILFVPLFVLAQVGNPGTTITSTIPNPFNCTGSECTLMGLITAIFENIILPIAAIGVTLWIVYAGFTFVTAQGNAAAIETAKKRLLWSLVGAGILLGAAGISEVVQNTVDSLIVP